MTSLEKLSQSGNSLKEISDRSVFQYLLFSSFCCFFSVLPWGKKRDIVLLTLLKTFFFLIKLPSFQFSFSDKIPSNLKEALNHPQWKKAMIEEMEALNKNDTWEQITLPRGKRTVGCGWVYTLKHKADGSIERARIVAKGFTQTYGYGTASIISRRLLLWPN